MEYATSQTHERKPKTFADLFQSLPPCREVATKSASSVERNHMNAAYQRFHCESQKESDMREKALFAQRFTTGGIVDMKRQTSIPDQAYQSSAQEHMLLLVEMNEKIQLLTRLVHSLNNDLCEKMAGKNTLHVLTLFATPQLTHDYSSS